LECANIIKSIIDDKILINRLKGEKSIFPSPQPSPIKGEGAFLTFLPEHQE